AVILEECRPCFADDRRLHSARVRRFEERPYAEDAGSPLLALVSVEAAQHTVVFGEGRLGEVDGGAGSVLSARPRRRDGIAVEAVLGRISTRGERGGVDHRGGGIRRVMTGETRPVLVAQPREPGRVLVIDRVGPQTVPDEDDDPRRTRRRRYRSHLDGG